MRVAYIGNFVPEHSTENHVRTAWLSHGHEVVRIQENNPEHWERLISQITDFDLVLWTSTRDFALAIGYKRQVMMLAAAQRAGVRTVGFHLDRWHGLDRETDLFHFPFFRCDTVITADGGAEWEAYGINHRWLPPAVSLPETELGSFSGNLASEITFVGTWRGYHREWEHRAYLIDWLKTTYPRSVRFWPRPGQPAIRGKQLRDLYQSVKIVVGDSCLLGGATHYWSDRIPETVGRGAFLLHPNVEGLSEHFEIGTHLDTWDAGIAPENFDALYAKIEHYRKNPEAAAEIAAAGRAHVIEHHTYEVRVKQIIELL